MLLDPRRCVRSVDLRHPDRWHLPFLKLRELPKALPNLSQTLDVPLERPTTLLLADAHRADAQFDPVLAVALPTPKRPWPDTFRVLQRRKVVLALPKTNLSPAAPLRMKALPNVLK